MTPLPDASQLQRNGPSFPSASPASKSTEVWPPLQQPGGRQASPSSHKKTTSVTSNPIQAPGTRSSQEHLQVSGASYDPLGTSHTGDSEYMSQTLSFEPDLSHGNHPGFPFDELMTPEYSDNQISEHTTPQELIWEQQFLLPDSDRPQIYQRPELGSSQSPQSSGNEFTGLLSSLDQDPPKFMTGSQLLSPQFTGPSSPHLPVRPMHTAEGLPTATGAPHNSRKRDVERLQVATSQSGLNPHVDGSPKERPISPIVVISSHQRGDSPARLPLPRARSSSKRGRANSLSQTADQAQSRSPSRSPHLSPIVNSTSLLAPPDYFESEVHPAEGDSRLGVDPASRSAEQVTSVNDLAEQREIDEKTVVVQEWLANSETGTPVDEPSWPGARFERPRAHSTGFRVDAMGLPIFSDRNIPGPGVLIDEDSSDEYSDDGSISRSDSEGSLPPSQSPPVTEAALRDSQMSNHTFPPLPIDEVVPELQEPLPKQFLRRPPWQDPVGGPITSDTQDQPASSNAAAMKFNQEAAKWDTASRAATWGTHRMLSETEINSIVDGSRVRHLSLAKRGRERGNTLLNKARGLMPRRSNSNIKKSTESPPRSKSPESGAPDQQDSDALTRTMSRHSSIGKVKPPKSPPLDTSSAFLAMTSNLTAVGQGSTSAVDTHYPKQEGLRSPLQMLRKVRSKSDAGKSPGKSGPGLAELITKHGGPPMPFLASPAQNHQQMMIPQPSAGGGTLVDDDDEDLLDEVGIKMDFKVRAENIIPNYEGFKIHARQLNPRLEPYLIDRIGQEQVRRYKKLIDNKIKHTRAVQVTGRCASGKHCYSLGGEATMLPPRVSSKDPEATYAQFQITNPGDEDGDEPAFEEGVVTPALFPPGIPLPPVKRLPAEFECTLCFKVKKFQKPSDWTKHVHEDVQPFSCTFPNCNEPKSFKRKADWVRHENERHRRLERWKCNVQECSHVCYRKDNFVQHLVREHKKAEPKIKRGSSSSKVKASPNNGWQSEDNEVLQLVESCRFETSTKPQDEPCRFCGNVCNSWKKLSVHMSKHMEQIAMPALELVNMKEVAADTVISPIEQNYHQNTGSVAAGVNQPEHQPSLSPYTVSAPSHHNSSAGQSPAAMQSHMQYGYEQGYYPAPIQGPVMTLEAYTSGMYQTNNDYAAGGSGQFGSINTQLESGYSGPTMHTPVSAHSVQESIPRSQPMGSGYRGSATTTSAGAPYSGSQLSYGPPPDVSPYQQYASGASGASQEPGLESQHQYPLATHTGVNGYVYNVQQVDNQGNGYRYR